MAQKVIDTFLTTTSDDFQILSFKLSKESISVDDLNKITIPNLDSKKGLIVSGRGPIWLYLYLYNKIKNVRWFASFDPRFGALITKAKNPKLIGAIVDLQRIKKFLPNLGYYTKVIALLGPPHSGKTVFMDTLFKVIIKKFDYLNDLAFIVKGAPDGEGLWSYEIPPAFAQLIRYKNKFSQNFVTNVIRNIKNISITKALVFVDCGGKMDDYNLQILKHCTSAIFIGPDTKVISQWRKFFRQTKPLAEVISILKDGENTSELNANGYYNITMHNLSRGNLNITIPLNFLEHFKL